MTIKEIYEQKMSLAQKYNASDVVNLITDLNKDIIVRDNPDMSIYMKGETIESCSDVFYNIMKSIYPDIKYMDYMFNMLTLGDKECIFSF